MAPFLLGIWTSLFPVGYVDGLLSNWRYGLAPPVGMMDSHFGVAPSSQGDGLPRFVNFVVARNDFRRSHWGIIMGHGLDLGGGSLGDQL